MPSIFATTKFKQVLHCSFGLTKMFDNFILGMIHRKGLPQSDIKKANTLARAYSGEGVVS